MNTLNRKPKNSPGGTGGQFAPSEVMHDLLPSRDVSTRSRFKGVSRKEYSKELQQCLVIAGEWLRTQYQACVCDSNGLMNCEIHSGFAFARGLVLPEEDHTAEDSMAHAFYKEGEYAFLQGAFHDNKMHFVSLYDLPRKIRREGEQYPKSHQEARLASLRNSTLQSNKDLFLS